MKRLTAIFHFSININPWPFGVSGDCCVYFTLGPNIVCKKKSKTLSNAHYSRHWKPLTDAFGHFSLFYCRAAIRLRLQVFFLLIILTANAHTQPEEVEVIKIFHWKTRSKTKDWMNLHLTSKKRKAKNQKRLRKQQHERTEKAFLQSSKKEANAKRFASAQFKDVFLDLVAGCGSMCLWFSLVGAAR